MNMPVETLADPIAAHAEAIIRSLGEDARRPGLQATPQRYARAMRFLTGGYEVEPEDVVGNGVFGAEGGGVVLGDEVEITIVVAAVLSDRPSAPPPDRPADRPPARPPADPPGG